jgi:hypothetical protein
MVVATKEALVAELSTYIRFYGMWKQGVFELDQEDYTVAPRVPIIPSAETMLF